MPCPHCGSATMHTMDASCIDDLRAQNGRLKQTIDYIIEECDKAGATEKAEDGPGYSWLIDAVKKLAAERDDFKAKFEFMVVKAMDEKLPAYREMGASLAAMESKNERQTIALCEIAKVGCELVAMGQAAGGTAEPCGECAPCLAVKALKE